MLGALQVGSTFLKNILSSVFVLIYHYKYFFSLKSINDLALCQDLRNVCNDSLLTSTLNVLLLLVFNLNRWECVRNNHLQICSTVQLIRPIDPLNFNTDIVCLLTCQTCLRAKATGVPYLFYVPKILVYPTCQKFWHALPTLFVLRA